MPESVLLCAGSIVTNAADCDGPLANPRPTPARIRPPMICQSSLPGVRSERQYRPATETSEPVTQVTRTPIFSATRPPSAEAAIMLTMKFVMKCPDRAGPHWQSNFRRWGYWNRSAYMPRFCRPTFARPAAKDRFEINFMSGNGSAVVRSHQMKSARETSAGASNQG